MSSAAAARAQRRRRLRERQALIFGAVITGVLIAAVFCGGIYLGLIKTPFDRPVQTMAAVTKDPVPCPPDGALPIPVNLIHANVYNGSEAKGLAGRTRADLATRGIVVLTIGNAHSYDGTVRLTFGKQAVAAAYTLAANFTNPVLRLDERTDATIDVVLGNQFSALADAKSAALDPTKPLNPVAGCVPADKIQLASTTPKPSK